LIGRSFPDPGLQTAIKELPYDVVDVGGKPAIKIETKNGISQLTPEEILGYVLEKLTSMAETHLNTSVRYAVLTVPSYFNDEQRDATKHAAEGTGLNVLRMVNEPTAIGIAHSLDTKPCDEAAGQFDCTYLLYDIQEKELDLTLLSVYRGVFEIIGAVHDDRMRWEVFHGSPVQNQVNLYDHISQQPEHIIRLVQQLLIDAKVKKTEINGIVCTGDPTHIAEVQTILKAYFPGTKTITPSDFLPDQAAVCGAATQGQVFNESQDSQPQIMDANVLSLGIEISNGTFLRIINRETVIPTRKFRTLSTSADGQGKIMIKIFEGERVIASKNKMIGSLELNGIPTASKGTQQIEITFEVDANEILTATAHLKGGSEVAKAVMPVRWMRYTLQEIDDIIQEAEKFNEDDLQHLKRTR
jgi:molecular chaperone DnaK (HSP70)